MTGQRTLYAYLFMWNAFLQYPDAHWKLAETRTDKQKMKDREGKTDKDRQIVVERERERERERDTHTDRQIDGQTDR